MVAVTVAVAALFFSGAQPALAYGPEDGCVAITGATGFAAGHMIELLLSRGYEVRGTVRDPSNKAKVAHLDALADKLPGSITYHKADLLAGPEVYKDCLLYTSPSPRDRG